MEQMNRIELKGNVGGIRVTDTATGRMARFSLATNYLFRSRDGEAGVETTWHNIVAWEGKSIKDLIKIEKGTSLYVVGRVRSTRYTGSDGVEKQSFEVVANRVSIIDDDPDEY